MGMGWNKFYGDGVGMEMNVWEWGQSCTISLANLYDN